MGKSLSVLTTNKEKPTSNQQLFVIGYNNGQNRSRIQNELLRLDMEYKPDVIYSGFQCAVYGNKAQNFYRSSGSRLWHQCHGNLEFDLSNELPSETIKFFKNNKIHRVFTNAAGKTTFWMNEDYDIFIQGDFNNTQNGYQQSEFFGELDNIMDIKSMRSYAFAITGFSRKLSTSICNQWLNSNVNIPVDIINLIHKFCNPCKVYRQHKKFTKTENWEEIPYFTGSETDIMKIGCGSGYSLFVADDGAVYGNGYNQHGQLGLGHAKDCIDKDDIIQIEYFITHKIKIRDVACGYDHNLMIDYQCNVYSFGRNSNGQCGHKTDLVSASMDKEVMSDVLEPRLITDFADMDIIEINCGSHHSHCKSSDELHFLFGSNKFSECITYDERISVVSPFCINDIVKKKTQKNEIKYVSLGCHNTKLILE